MPYTPSPYTSDVPDPEEHDFGTLQHKDCYRHNGALKIKCVDPNTLNVSVFNTETGLPEPVPPAGTLVLQVFGVRFTIV